MINNNYDKPFGIIGTRARIKYSSVCASEANEIGQNILIKLSEQGDLLKNSEEKMEYNSYFLSKTIRILRNMTWIGWMLNFFTRKPDDPYEDFKREKKNMIKEQQTSLLDTNEEDLLNVIDPKIQFTAIIKAEDKEISNLEKELKHLHFIGLKINEYLDDHNKELTLLVPKTEDLIIKTTTTKNRAASLTNG